jgi:predicted permease
MLLLISAGLFIRAMNHAKSLYPGKEPSTVWLAAFHPKEFGYTIERSREFYRQLMQSVSAIPGVQSVGLTHNISGALGSSNTSIQVEGQGDEWRKTESNTIGPGYFKTLGVTLLRGRELTDADRVTSPHVVIVNESLAQRYWPNEEALGKRLRNSKIWMEVVGVVENGKFRIAGQVEPPMVYTPYAQKETDSPFSLIVRVSGDPASVMAALRYEVQRIDPGVPVLATMSLPDAVDFGALPLRIAGAAASGFGFIGLLLAAIGIYGLVSYSVAQRTQEIGVRVALGATRTDILRLVMLRGFKLAAIGLGIGVALALATTQVLAELLFGIGPADPLTFTGVAVLLAATTLAASWLPARRASRVDPMVALRYE